MPGHLLSPQEFLGWALLAMFVAEVVEDMISWLLVSRLQLKWPSVVALYLTHGRATRMQKHSSRLVLLIFEASFVAKDRLDMRVHPKPRQITDEEARHLVLLGNVVKVTSGFAAVSSCIQAKNLT